MASSKNKNLINGEVNLIDLFFYLLGKWPWFVLSVAIFVGLSLYRYEKTDRTYFSTSTVFIKDPANKTYSASLGTYDNFINKVNVTNEIYRLRSKNLLTKVVNQTRADVLYKVPERLHMKELYSQSPVTVSFINATPSSSYSFKITPTNSESVVLSEFGLAAGSYKINLRDTVTVGGVILTVSPTDFYTTASYGNPIQVTKVPVPSMVGFYQANLGIRQTEEDAPILSLSLKDSSPRKAYEVICAIVETYNIESVNDKNQVAINTERFINERIKIIESELSVVEEELEDFKIENDLVLGIGTAAGQFYADRSQYSDRALELDSQIQMAQFIKEYIDDPTKDLDLIPANTGLTSASVEQQIAQYNDLRIKKNRLVEEGGENNPVISEMASTMRQMKQSIIRSIDNYIYDLKTQKDTYLDRESEANYNLNTMPSKERQLLSIERQQKIKESLYTFLLNRREENAITRAMVDNNAQVIDDPDASNAPIAPSRNKYLFLGLLIGLALPAIWFLIKLFADTKVHTRQELKDAVAAPFLGEIPLDKEYLKLKKSGVKKVMVKEKPDGITAESFSILRTNLHFVRHEGQAIKVITLTSFNESSGKTFIAANLAMSFKKTGKSVAMLDLDIRKATLSKLFNCKKIGVTNYLSDPSLTVDDIIQKDNLYGDLDIIAAGPVAPNPAELLVDSRLDELVNVLRERYDIVIVDNVPVGVVADAKISNRVTDATLFVARAGIIDRRQFPDLDDLYNNKELTNMLLVFNGTDTRSLGYNNYGYGYGYGHSYGYGRYGYGNGYYGKEKKKKGLIAKLFGKK